MLMRLADGSDFNMQSQPTLRVRTFQGQAVGPFRYMHNADGNEVLVGPSVAALSGVTFSFSSRGAGGEELNLTCNQGG